MEDEHYYWYDNGTQYRASVEVDEFCTDPREDMDNLGHIVLPMAHGLCLTDEKNQQLYYVREQCMYGHAQKVCGVDVLEDVVSGTALEADFNYMNNCDEWQPDFLQRVADVAGYLLIPLQAWETQGGTVEVRTVEDKEYPERMEWHGGGFIYCSKEEAEAWGFSDKEWQDSARAELESEIETLNMYTNNQVYYVSIEEQRIIKDMRTCFTTETWEQTDSCGGIYSSAYGSDLVAECLDACGVYHGQQLSEVPLDDSTECTGIVHVGLNRDIADALEENGYERSAENIAAVIADDDLCKQIVTALDSDARQVVQDAIYLMDDSKLTKGGD